MPSELRFEPCSQRYGLFLVCGCRQLISTKFGVSGGLFGPFPGHMVELEGRKGLVDTRKSSRTWSVPTLSLCLPVLNVFPGCFGPKMAVFGPKLQFLKVRSATCDTRSWPPPLSFWLKLCVVVPHTHRYHPPKFQPNPKHHDGDLVWRLLMGSPSWCGIVLTVPQLCKAGKRVCMPSSVTCSRRSVDGRWWCRSMRTATARTSRVQQETTATIQNTPRNNSDHPKRTGKQQRPSRAHQEITVTIQMAPGNSHDPPEHTRK